VEAGLNLWLGLLAVTGIYFFCLKGRWVKKVAVGSVYYGGGGSLCLRVWFSVM